MEIILGDILSFASHCLLLARQGMPAWACGVPVICNSLGGHLSQAPYGPDNFGWLRMNGTREESRQWKLYFILEKGVVFVKYIL